MQIIRIVNSKVSQARAIISKRFSGVKEKGVDTCDSDTGGRCQGRGRTASRTAMSDRWGLGGEGESHRWNAAECGNQKCKRGAWQSITGMRGQACVISTARKGRDASATGMLEAERRRGHPGGARRLGRRGAAF